MNKGTYNPELCVPQNVFPHRILSLLKKRDLKKKKERKSFLQAEVKQTQRIDPVSKINIKLKSLSIWLNLKPEMKISMFTLHFLPTPQQQGQEKIQHVT